MLSDRGAAASKNSGGSIAQNSLCMKATRFSHWLAAAAIAAGLPVTAARAMSGHGGGGFAGGGPHGSFGHGFSHPVGPRHDFTGHRFASHRFGDRRFFDHDRDDHFFHHHNRFFFGFDFAAFGFPYWWYPDYYYGYPYDYASYDYSPVYDYRYWYGLATAVQTELARRGYYHGPIDGVIGSGSREAIREFQQAQGLPVTGLVDPALLKALKLPAVPRVAAADHGSVLNFG
jgi:putative peptidoglycan binding protein